MTVPGTERETSTEVYLGDGLYASFDGFQVKVYSSNGINATNEIYLEPVVFAALAAYCNRIWRVKP